VRAIVGEIGRVLTPEACRFLVLGDTYASQPGRYRGGSPRRRGISPRAVRANGTATDRRILDAAEKSLCLVPWRRARRLALEDGWRVANVIARVKPNHQPEHVYDRLTQAWSPGRSAPRPGSHRLVLDPFAGSGTVRDVAQAEGRRFLGCDLLAWGAESEAVA
jgi:hypothetical protein